MRELLLAAAVFALAACGQGGTTQSSGAPEATATTSAAQAEAATPESDILKLYASYDAYETAAAAIAADHAQAQATKDFAAARAQAHGAAQAALAEGARAAGASAPDGALNDDMQAYLGMLRNAQPAQFDGTYASQQSLMHTTTIGRLTQFASDHPDSPLAGWANARATELQAVSTEARTLPR